MSQHFSEALNDCLDRLARGESVYDCLARHPESAADLEPLLEVAVATMRAAESVRPDESAKARSFQRFSQAVEARAQASRTKQAEHAARSRWSWLVKLWGPVARPVTVAALCLIVFASGIGATTAAASNSLPGEALYWVKTTRESIERRIPRSDTGRANYEVRLAQTRGDEVRALMKRGYFSKADKTMERMNHHLGRSAKYAGVTIVVTPVEMPLRPAARIGFQNARQLTDQLEKDRAVFKVSVIHLMGQLPPQDRERAQHMLWKTELGYWLLIDAMQNSRPNTGEHR